MGMGEVLYEYNIVLLSISIYFTLFFLTATWWSPTCRLGGGNTRMTRGYSWVSLDYQTWVGWLRLFRHIRWPNWPACTTLNLDIRLSCVKSTRRWHARHHNAGTMGNHPMQIQHLFLMEAYASTSVMFALTEEQQLEDKTSQGRRRVCLRPQCWGCNKFGFVRNSQKWGIHGETIFVKSPDCSWSTAGSFPNQLPSR